MWFSRDCCFLCACLHYPTLIPLDRQSTSTTTAPPSLVKQPPHQMIPQHHKGPPQQHTRTPLHPAALASVPYGIVLVRVRVPPQPPIKPSIWISTNSKQKKALAHRPSEMPLSCPVAPASQRELHKDGGGGGGGVAGKARAAATSCATTFT